MSEAIVGVNQLKAAFDQLRDYLAKWKDPQPPFEFSLGWADDYDSLFHGRVAVTNADEVLNKVVKTGRVLISGRGGAAKTTLVYRLLSHLQNDQFVLPILMNLKSWTEPIYKDWNQLPKHADDRMEFLLSHVSIPRLNLALLDAVDPQVMKLIVADGLNEITPDTAQEIIAALDGYVRRAHQSGVIITDRIVRRQFANPMRWNFCAIQPLSTESVQKYLQNFPEKLAVYEKAGETEKVFLSTPLFLDQFIRSAGPNATRLLTNAAELKDYFINRVGLVESELQQAASGAYAAYERQPSRTFSISDFEKIAGTKVTQKLVTAGTVQIEEPLAFFQHHLHQDYLVAYFLTKSVDYWNHEYFNKITFEAASFDVLALTLEQIEDTSRVDLFLEKLYDWNVYAPGYALAEAYQGGRVQVSMETEVIVLAMLAERRWDRFASTVQRASDGLALFPNHTNAFRRVQNLTELFDLVRSLKSDNNSFNRWRRLFTLSSSDGLSDEEIRELLKNDSVVGWTLANVLKRIAVTESQLQFLRRSATERNQSETVVWRLAHVLGAYPSKENMELLFGIFEKTQMPWASYGALRSLVELAARTKEGELTAAVFDRLASKLDILLGINTLRSFPNLLFIKPVPDTWAKTIVTFLERIYASVQDDAERERWSAVARRFLKVYPLDKVAVAK